MHAHGYAPELGGPRENLERARWYPSAGAEQKTASIRPRGDLTLYVFLLMSCCVYPTWFGRAGTERKQQQQHDSVIQGPPCHHRAQGSSVNPFGYPPLSDHQKQLEYAPVQL